MYTQSTAVQTPPQGGVCMAVDSVLKVPPQKAQVGFLRRNLQHCPAKLRDCIYNVSPFYVGVCSVHLGSSFGQGL